MALLKYKMEGGIESTEQLQNKENLAKTKIAQIDFTQASSHTHLA